MVIVRSWLEQYIDLDDLTHTALAHTLTHLGLEVEKIETTSPLDPLIVVGEIQQIRPHPHADSLQIAHVDVGGGKERCEIVCGASNIVEGMKVATAQVGSQLPDGTKIKSSRIRQVRSAGMILSAEELDLTPLPCEGIYPLDEKAVVGRTVGHLLDIQQVLFYLAITPNRGDCLSYIGIARDLACKLNRPYQKPSHDRSWVKKLSPVALSLHSNRGHSDRRSEGCLRYMALFVDGVCGSEFSPMWMQRLLYISGIRPHNLMVDMTNYLMLIWGQPMHVFDADQLHWQQEADSDETEKVIDLAVSRGCGGHLFKGLDGSQLTCDDEDLMITSQHTPVALAGVMGGQNSEVTDHSRRYVIEIADFCPRAVAESAKRHKLHSESSHRFERGIDGLSIGAVAEHTATLLHMLMNHDSSIEIYQPMEILSGREAAPYGELSYGEVYSQTHVALRVDRARMLLGMSDLSCERCIDILDGLECDVVDQRNSRLVVSIPSHRSDLCREVDLIEEVARMIGLDEIPSNFPLLDPRKITAREHPNLAFYQRLKQAVSDLGLCEVVVYPMVSETDLKSCLLSSDHPMYPNLKIVNPMSEHHLLPVTLMSSMMKTLSYNRSRRPSAVQMFQMARGYYRSSSSGSSSVSAHGLSWWRSGHQGARGYIENTTDHVCEISLLHCVWDGGDLKDSSSRVTAESAFYAKKAVIEQLFGCFGADSAMQYHRVDPEALPFLHPAYSAIISLSGQYFGYFGVIHPQVARHWNLGSDQNCVVAEIQFDVLADTLDSRPSRPHRPLYKYPLCLRDLALVVAKPTQVAEVMQAITEYPKRRYFHGAELFDVFEGEQLGAHHKSLAFRISYIWADGTLTDRQVDKEMNGLCEYLLTQYGYDRRS